jgi:hypothetical protein
MCITCRKRSIRRYETGSLLDRRLEFHDRRRKFPLKEICAADYR